MVTYRLADALPAGVIRECQLLNDEAESRRRLEKSLDSGYGSCLLRRPDIANVIVANWKHFDAVLYGLVAWVVMPNHVHVMIEVDRGYQLSRIVHAWKSFTAKQIARRTPTRGRVWQPDYWDRVIRNESHFDAAVE
jgi:REP-associated tyrosine transposase